MCRPIGTKASRQASWPTSCMRKTRPFQGVYSPNYDRRKLVRAAGHFCQAHYAVRC
jgi:hypothetical protein